MDIQEVNQEKYLDSKITNIFIIRDNIESYLKLTENIILRQKIENIPLNQYILKYKQNFIYTEILIKRDNFKNVIRIFELNLEENYEEKNMKEILISNKNILSLEITSEKIISKLEENQLFFNNDLIKSLFHEVYVIFKDDFQKVKNFTSNIFNNKSKIIVNYRLNIRGYSKLSKHFK